MIQNQADSQKPVAQINGLIIVTSLTPLPLHANKTLIEVLLTNLFHNAIRYSTKGETIHVSIQNRTLSVSNKGKPLTLSFEQMTQRFSKESTDPNSTGLGLAIVKKICDSCGYKLGYSFEGHTHTFSITF